MSHRPEPEPGVLYLVGTPIGHLGDLSPRAKSLLAKVSTIACEDTRHSCQLLNSVGGKAKRLSYHKHNCKKKLPKLLEILHQGKSLALISDAGLPGISDPGEELVNAARKEGLEVICIPGPCAATTALVSSGLPSDQFCFEGFLPAKGQARKLRLDAICKETRTTVLYEAPHRLTKLLEELLELCEKERPLQISRELTKKHEQHIGPTIGSALEFFQKYKPQGECTLVLGGAPKVKEQEKSDEYLLSEVKALIQKGVTASDAARQVAEASGKSRRVLYALLHKSMPK